MTPNTQSVCKHCGQLEGSPIHNIHLANETPHRYEPSSSGDALKVEEIRPRCPNCGRWNVCLRRDFDDRLYVTCGACNFEVPLNMGTIECLSPFFPLTSTVRSSPDSHLGAVRD